MHTIQGSATTFRGDSVVLTAPRIHIQDDKTVRKKLKNQAITLGFQKARVKLPVSSLLAWYPLYFYYDWVFDDTVGDFVLECLPHTPKATKAIITADVPYTLSKCLCYKDKYLTGVFDTTANFLYLDNISLCTDLIEFSRGTLVTLLSDNISEQAIKGNYTYINDVSKNIRSACYCKYLKSVVTDTKLAEHPLPANSEYRDRILYQFATDSDLRTLIKMGVASRLTDVLHKAYKGKLLNT